MTRAKLTPDDREAIAAMRERGEKLAVIAARFNISDGYAWNVCLERCAEHPTRRIRIIPLPTTPFTKSGRPRTQRRFTTEEDARITSMRLDGLGVTAIGRAIGRSHTSVIKRLLTLARHEAARE